MIVGVDPDNTDLSPEERDKVIVKAIVRLQVACHFKSVTKREDGTIQVIFSDGEGYEYDVYLKDGLVFTSYDNIDRSGMKHETFTPCKGHYDPHKWRSLCHEGCGCPCALSQGFLETPEPHSASYSSHCKDYDETKVIPDPPYVPRPYIPPSSTRGPIGMTGPAPPKGVLVPPIIKE